MGVDTPYSAIDQNSIDFDEVFALVPRLETLRLLIALASEKGWKTHHLDVKTAFLHGDLKEEVYVVQPKGFEKLGEERKVYKLDKSLYGLRQAPRAWNIKLDNTLKEMGFQQCMQEKAVYKKVSNEEFIIVAIYVDDLVVIGTSLELIKEFTKRMAAQFEMSGLRELTYYPAKDEPEVEATQYRKVVGCLHYLLHTRPTLTCSTRVFSRYMQSPRESHARAIKQILRYLSFFSFLFLKSTTGHVFYLGTSPITWCSQKQTTMALSSCEVEFVVAIAVACQAIWLRELLAKATCLERQKVIIQVDNKSTIALSKNPIFHDRSKHIHSISLHL
ncbi:putative pol polyprotein [Tanacetum coccineum]